MPEPRTLHPPQPQNLRSTELRRLLEVVDRRPARRSTVLEVLGEPGSGKSTLLAELARHAGGRGLTVLRARSAPAEREMPFHALLQAFTQPSPSPFAPFGGTSSLRTLRQATAPEPVTYGFLPALRVMTPKAMRDLLTEFVRDDTALLLDDFHWADLSSAELVEDLLRTPLSTPLTVVVAHRPRQAHTGLRQALLHAAAVGAGHREELPPLSRVQSALLLGLTPADERLTPVHHAGEGNPTLLRLALADAMNPRVRGLVDDGPVPDDIATALIGDITTLGSTHALVAATAAVIGEQFGLHAVAAVAELTYDEVCRASSQLAGRDIFRTTDSGAQFTFRHAGLRRLVYNRADPCWRMRAHRRAMSTLSRGGAPAAVVARHIERSLPEGCASDLETLTRAAREALPAGPEAAAHWLRLALRIMPQKLRGTALHRDLLIRVTGLLATTGGLAENRDLLDELLVRAASLSGPERLSVVIGCAWMHTLLGDFDRARGLLTADLARAHETGSAERAPLILQLDLLDLHEGRPGTPHAAETALALALAHGDRVTEAGALAQRALHRAMDRDATGAAEAVARATAALGALGDAELAERPEYLAVSGWALALLGDARAAEEHCRRGLPLARMSPSCHAEPLLLTGLAYAYGLSGRLHTARRTAAEARTTVRPCAPGQVQAVAKALEAWCLAALHGRDDPRAEALAAEAEASLSWYGSGLGSITTLRLADAARLRGEPEHAMALLLTTGNGPELPELPAWLRAEAHEVLACCAVTTGDQSAREYADRAWAAGRSITGPPHAAAHGEMGRAHVLRTTPSHAVTLYLSAARHFSEAGMVWWQARALHLAAHCAGKAGDHGRRASLLTLADALARRCGEAWPPPFPARAVRPPDAPEPGPRPPAAPTAPPHPLVGLSSREREVAVLAGMGLKTKEVAQRLSLSPRTVDSHLNRIYRKLDITSRASLVRILARAD
ncbi:helix-turn-helix transcriptional regulator [Streptomyces qinzhouensis]|uniref:AAA family ATPase n=1 Tax=Streptomyces qinzhouensis TaxID=2599401 RepID=A0A5B8JR61_9ACTN|nr:AAA family ATPase [Streptomyces qinzhouensis]QDY80450.1 AAA family ATPase [Streptomyces qinzhouensis]